MLDLRIQQHFIDSADLHYQVAETLAKPVDAAVQAVLACVTGGGKVLVGGMGPSAALAQYLRICWWAVLSANAPVWPHWHCLLTL
jgi:D-sedoheptulose 7-phosphate isomerase